MNREWTAEDELRHENEQLRAELDRCAAWLKTAPLDLEGIKRAASDDSWIPARMALALVAEVERLRAGIETVAAKLQGLGHETPWKYGRELRDLIDPPPPPDPLDPWAAIAAARDMATEQ